MNKKYIISALITGALCLLPLNSNTTTTFRRPEKSYAAGRSLYSGLIEKCALKCSGQDGIICITAKTQSSGKMRKIGFTDMTIQRSSDHSSWSTEKDLGDLLGANVRFYTLDNYTETVDGGYYYRVVCDHYAEGVPVSGDNTQIQETPNASKDVWIDPDPDSAVTTTTTTKPVTTTTTTRTTRTTTKPATTTTKPVTTVTKAVRSDAVQSRAENNNDSITATATTTRALFGPVSYSPKNGMSSHSSNANKGGESSVISGGGQKTSRNSSSSSDSKDKSGKSSSSSDSSTSSPKTGAVPPTAAILTAISSAAAAFAVRRRKK